MNFFRKEKGVISVFLIIIMLPLLTSAVLLVDGTRYHSAKTLIQEAGDLAAYSTIANYNMDLKEEYGLFALNDPNVNEVFKKYFSESLGYSAEESETYSKQVQDLISSAVFRGGKYKDANFFNLYNFNIANVGAKGMYPLSEPGVLQNQIVEYTKYRGIETLLERFEILNKFDQVSKETIEAQETMAAVESLSGIEESGVKKVSNGLTVLCEQVNSYNANLTELFNKADEFCKCAAEELSAMAVKDAELFNKKQRRIDAYNDMISAVDDIVALAEEINADAVKVSEWAQRAIDELENFQRNYPEQEDACRTAQDDIDILHAVLEPIDNEFSLWNLRQNISAGQANALKSSLTDKFNGFLKSVQKTYTNYAADANANGAEAARYHIYSKSGEEWSYTATDHVDDGTDVNAPYTSAGVLIAEYIGQIMRNPERIGTVNLTSYQVSFANKFLDVANEREKEKKPRSDMSAEDAVDKANTKKQDAKKEDKPEYATISNELAATLPSRCSEEQKEIDIPDVTTDQAGDTLSAANSTSSNILNNFLESGRNDILTYCYLLDNFKTRVTASDINADMKPNGVSDRNLADWRYNEPNGETDMRYRAKKDLDTFFATNEVEYVFAGCKSEFNNAAIVYSWIYGTRFVNNFIAVYSAYSGGDSWIRVDIDGMAAAASALTFGAVPFTVFKWVFLTAWAAGETALDLSLLIDGGYKIPLIKTKDSLFLSDIFKIGDAIDPDKHVELLRGKRASQSTFDKITVSYEDYLIILLAFVNRETRLKRVADLIQLNMQKRYGAEFTMDKAFTYIQADTEVSIRYLFQPVKQFSSSYSGVGLKLHNTIYQGY